jgi:hypothetical protein
VIVDKVIHALFLLFRVTLKDTSDLDLEVISPRVGVNFFFNYGVRLLVAVYISCRYVRKHNQFYAGVREIKHPLRTKKINLKHIVDTATHVDTGSAVNDYLHILLEHRPLFGVHTKFYSQ